MQGLCQSPGELICTKSSLGKDICDAALEKPCVDGYAFVALTCSMLRFRNRHRRMRFEGPLVQGEACSLGNKVYRLFGEHVSRHGNDQESKAEAERPCAPLSEF